MKLSVENGEFVLKPDSYEDRKILELSAQEYGRVKAEQEALQKVYKIGPELFKRLQLGENTVYQAIHDKRLRAIPAGKKGYRVTELACRKFLQDL